MENGKMQIVVMPRPAARPKSWQIPDSCEIPEPESEEKERFVEAYWERIVEEVERFIQEEGVAFFRLILAKCGTLNVITPGPHPIQKREGQLIRNIMKRTSCRHWREEDYMRYWEDIIIAALDFHEKKKAAKEQARLDAIAREEMIRKRKPRLARGDD